jgi:hypothetical protein
MDPFVSRTSTSLSPVGRPHLIVVPLPADTRGINSLLRGYSADRTNPAQGAPQGRGAGGAFGGPADAWISCGATEPDEDLYFEIDGEATATAVPETLYMVMSNAQAVTELIRLFDLWRANPAIAFERGRAPLKQAFAMLRAVRRWGPADRIRETGLLEAWAEDVAVVDGQGLTRVEIELWFRDDVVRRTSAQTDVERLIGAARGAVISSAVVPSIDYHAVLADLPYDQVQAVLERGPEAIELLTTESIMFVVPARPMTIPAIELSALAAPSFAPAHDAAPPRVALLVGLPLANHTVLANRMIIDDPDERAHQYNSGQHSRIGSRGIVKTCG